jgi:hypothetical protein
MPQTPRHLECLIDKILPCREIHLVGGASGSSKTTLMFQILQKWQRGEEVFGYASFPVPMAYVACERSLDSTQRTVDRCAVDLKCPNISALEHGWLKDVDHAFERIAAYLTSRHPETRMWYLDGLQALTPGGKNNDYACVLRFLTDITQFCQTRNVTVIGSVHATKTKEGERYMNPRQRILGSVAWAGFSETVIILDQIDPEDPASRREIQLCPRNAPQGRFDYELDSNGLIVFTQNDQVTKAGRPDTKPQHIDNVLARLAELDPETSLPRATLNAFLADLKLSERTLDRVLKQMVEDKLLRSPEKGVYQRGISS